jgi:hypothetical protein
MFSTGLGWKYSSRYFPLNTTLYSENFDYYIVKRDPAIYNWANVILNYRSGVLSKYPFGKGLEIGYHIETAFRMNRVITKGDIYCSQWGCDSILPDTSREFEFFSPPLLEIEARFGFPDYTLGKCLFHHNLSLGWITGQYIDNGWFAGYAAGWEYHTMIPYVNMRLFCTATDKLTDPNLDEETYFIRHNRKFVMRISGGTSFILPYNHSLLPEFISPEVSLLFPNFSIGQPVGVSFSAGVRWMLGR